MKQKYCLFTNDVEDQSIWHNALRVETGRKVLTEGLPILLDLYDAFEIKCTFFITGFVAKTFPAIVKLIGARGHEVASHGYSHEVEKAFDKITLKQQIEQLKKAKWILEDISGDEVISFRAPALRVNKDTPLALASTGFKIDSSVSPQRMDMFLSFGATQKLKWLSADRFPYRTDESSLFKKGTGPITEVPLSAFFLGYTGTTMRVFPSLIGILRTMLNLENALTARPIVFLIHPNEFIDESDEKRTIQRRSSNFVSYLLRDLVRSRMKVRNLGPSAKSLYLEELTYFVKKNYTFDTIRNYCVKERFLEQAA